MQRIVGSVTVLVIAAGVIFGQSTPGSQSAAARSERAVLRAAIENPVAKQGEPVFVKILLKNVSSDLISITRTRLERDYRIVITGRSGRRPALSDYGQRMSDGSTIVSSRVEDLAPGQQHWATIEITNLYDLLPPDVYTVQISREVRVNSTNTTAHYESAIGDPVTFTVVPEGSSELQTSPEKGIRSLSSLFPAETRAALGLSTPTQVVSVSLHEPVVMQLVFQNISAEIIELETSRIAEKEYRVSVTRPNGSRVDLLQPREGV